MVVPASPLSDLRGKLTRRREIREELTMRRAERWVEPVACVRAGGARQRLRGRAARPSLPIDDPNEQFNRGVLAVNQAVLDPVANVVKAVTPGPILDRLRRSGRQPQGAAHFRE